MNQFKNPLDPENIKAKDLLKKWLSTKLKLEATTHIDITEYQCADPGCLHAETVFQVFEAAQALHVTGSRSLSLRGTDSHREQSVSKTEGVQIYKIAKPLVFIRQWDIDAIVRVTDSKNVVHKH